MWARLQGVGNSVRADTALPWPLPLLHKTSQPALSPGLESVSAATCQIKNKKEKTKKETLSLPSSSLCHQPSSSPSPPLCSRSSASSLMSCACGKTHHTTYAFRQPDAACLSYKPRLPFCLLPVVFQGNSSSVQSGLDISDSHAADYEVWCQKFGRSQGLWLP